MSAFNKLSAVAQYDDMCRYINSCLSQIGILKQDLETQTRFFDKEFRRAKLNFEKEKEEFKNENGSLQKEIKKLNRQLAEARSALVREAEDKKFIARERKSLLDQMRQVRELVLSNDNYNIDEHRRRVIKCLDVDKLSTIHSDDSDECDEDLDYDRTEEEIVENNNDTSRRSGRGLNDDHLDLNEQPTLLYRYLDKASDENDIPQQTLNKEERRRSRRSETARSSYHRSSQGAAEIAAAAELVRKNKQRIASMALDTDSNTVDTDDNDIEHVRQELQKYEESKKDRIASTISTPSMKHKSATLSAKSSASLMRNLSTKSCSTPVPTSHTFISKRCFKPNPCGPCGKKIPFYGIAAICESCGTVSHVECQNQCPLPCVKITTPSVKSRSRKILISDYVNNDAIPKVPALIIHLCNEIERDANITTDGLYRAAARTTEVEQVLQKILKSKTGMPNLSGYDVHLLANVVKRFLQSLDESLITTTLWSRFSEAAKQESGSVEDFKYFTNRLPVANRETLAYLMLHLHAVAKHSDRNLMTKESLAKALAPTIVGNSVRNPPSSTIMEENKRQLQIMLTLFEIEEDFWSEYVHKEPVPKTPSLGSRLLDVPQSSGVKTRSSTRNSRFMGATLPTPKMKPLFSS